MPHYLYDVLKMINLIALKWGIDTLIFYHCWSMPHVQNSLIMISHNLFAWKCATNAMIRHNMSLVIMCQGLNIIYHDFLVYSIGQVWDWCHFPRLANIVSLIPTMLEYCRALGSSSLYSIFQIIGLPWELEPYN